ncbi:hypothetical protein BB561_000550 [Smittium simulii]|uniref:Uncharacterized protein n=1 Tax=Smittium simulii TaxID=133385 RepID=A0A2T9YYM9_9FUNG|nr:hypothetical protein BB561_000550 [Smittium simulii]
MSNIPGVNQSAATKLPFPSAKRTRLEYNTVAKTGLIEHFHKKLGHWKSGCPELKNFKQSNYNMDTVQVQKCIKKSSLNLMQCQVENSTGSRYNKPIMDRMLGYILYRNMESVQTTA